MLYSHFITCHCMLLHCSIHHFNLQVLHFSGELDCLRLDLFYRSLNLEGESKNGKEKNGTLVKEGKRKVVQTRGSRYNTTVKCSANNRLCPLFQSTAHRYWLIPPSSTKTFPYIVKGVPALSTPSFLQNSSPQEPQLSFIADKSWYMLCARVWMAQVDGSMFLLKHRTNKIRQQFISLNLDTNENTTPIYALPSFYTTISLKYLMQSLSLSQRQNTCLQICIV